jgi:hypothetical protein
MRLLILGVLLIGLPTVLPGMPAARAQSANAEGGRAERIKAELREILSSPQYQAKPPQESVFSRVLRRIGEGLKAFWRWFSGLFGFGSGLGVGGGNLFFWIVLVAVIVGIAYVIAYSVRRADLKRGDNGSRKLSISDEPEESAAASPEDWLAAAKRHAVAGDYRRAYRAVFIGLLLRLDRMGAIRFERSRTNGEYLRELRARPSIYSWMSSLAGDFDARWYGKAPVAEDDYHRLLRAFDNVPATQ